MLRNKKTPKLPAKLPNGCIPEIAKLLSNDTENVSVRQVKYALSKDGSKDIDFSKKVLKTAIKVVKKRQKALKPLRSIKKRRLTK